MTIDDEDDPGLGSCCVCESVVNVHTVIMLHQKAPMPGHGWGCVVCGLSSDGALAVICDACAEAFASVMDPPLRFACCGYPASDGRVPITSLAGTHDHDMSRHRFEDDPNTDWPDDDPSVPA